MSLTTAAHSAQGFTVPPANPQFLPSIGQFPIETAITTSIPINTNRQSNSTENTITRAGQTFARVAKEICSTGILLKGRMIDDRNMMNIYNKHKYYQAYKVALHFKNFLFFFG
jgi:hypothetical protein